MHLVGCALRSNASNVRTGLGIGCGFSQIRQQEQGWVTDEESWSPELEGTHLLLGS